MSALFPGLSEEQVSALEMDNLGVWCALRSFEVDHKPFTFKRREYLKKIYLSSTPKMTVMKCTQVGLTIYMALRALHILRYAEECGKRLPRKVGFYFPGFDSVNKFSKDRLKPLINNIPEFQERVMGIPSIDLIQFGRSSLYTSYFGGLVTTDSTPLDVLCLDEVRLMDPKEINRVEERLSGCEDPRIFKVSTAGYPDDAIDKAFKEGMQWTWHTECNCSDGVVLSDVFPECIGLRKNSKGRDDYFYRCPTCSRDCLSPRVGGYVAHNASAEYDSFHLHQMLSHTKTAKDIYTAYLGTDNPKEFMNAKLGRPYVDKENIGVTQEELLANVNTDVSWGKENNTCMGVDQRSGDLHICVGKIVNGKKRLLHLEVVDQHHSRYKVDGEIVSPFKRLYSVMQDFDVDFCVLDALPNANEAKDFARAFPGRVFLSYYKGNQEMVRWSDKAVGTKKHDDEPAFRRKSEEELKFKWVVLLDRYKVIQYALQQWVDRRVECPNPRGILQEVRDSKTGAYRPEFLCESVFFLHLRSVVREYVQAKADPGSYSYRWINIGLDPHFLHAWTYLAVALERKKGGFAFDFWG